MSDVTVTPEAPQPNTPEARTSDGTLRDASTPNTIPTSSETTPSSTEEGGSFLTGKKDDPKPEVKPEAKEGDAPKPEAPAGAPEKYGDFKLPEGYKFDPTQLEKAQALFKANNLSQEQAQGLVDFYAANGLQAAKAPYEAWAALQRDWNTEIASRFGDRAPQVRSDINKAIDVALPPSLAKNFRAALDLTGAGTHPDMVEALSILFRPHYEGTPVKGNGPSKESQAAPGTNTKPSIAEAMYPHLIPNRQQ